jgi:hypothetical protein
LLRQRQNRKGITINNQAMIISKSAFLQKPSKVFDDEECIITQVIPEDFLG